MAEALGRIGIGRLTSALQPSANVRVLLFHDVSRNARDGLRAVLEATMESRQPLAPDALLELCGPQRSAWTGGPRFSVTFDDGMLSSYEATQSVLEPLGLKAAFFVPTAIFELRSEQQMRAFRHSYLGARSAPSDPDDILTMSRDHVLELHRQGHAIFPHTHNHVPLTKIDTAALAERELRQPRQIIEDLVQQPAPALAIPYGDAGSVGKFGYRAAEQHYELCFTAIPGVNTARTSPHFLRRDPVDPGDSLVHVENLLGGALDLPYGAKMWRLKRRAGASRL